MSEYHLYILRCADNSLYTGIALDVGKRLEEHQEGKRGARYLRGRGPLQLVFSRKAGDRGRASRLEYRVKRLSKADKEALVSGSMNIDALVEDGG